MRYCTKCGNQLEANLKFCTQCGAPAQAQPETPQLGDTQQPASNPAPQAQPVPTPPPAPAAGWQALPVSPMQPQPPAKKSSWIPAVLIALSVLAFIAVLGIGGLVYAGYKVKQKATAMIHKAEKDSSPLGRLATDLKSADAKPREAPDTNSPDASAVLGDLAKMLGAATPEMTPGDGDPVPSVSERDPVEPCPAASLPPESSARIPLQEGTVITTAWGVKYQDVESRISVMTPTPVAIATSHTTSSYKDDNGREQTPSAHNSTVCNVDIASAGTYVTVVGTHIPGLIHGVTRLRMSDKSFSEVKASGKTNFEYLDFMQAGNAVKPVHDAGPLARVEPQDVPYPMILNDERTTLPSIHLAGIFESKPPDPRSKKWRPNHAAVDLYVLDDAADPLVLLWKEKDPAFHDGKFRVEVVKIDFKTQHPVNTVEKQLTEQKRAVTYGIYFDFNKDTIKTESEPVLKQIVQAMADNPAWKLTVEGHTDNIGGDSYNLDLSKRRAAAVKQALVMRYHIAADRLSTDGFGASRPVETNDTLEGRARNRRVELTRE
ncbi:OmpA family protein [Telmatobacter sp. DSM 110680]|uniref:OmpA family protein n=1 Tax=Telmatobacter sp. DSM 110680 TaxID=3036704 RepID=A0AAU7DKE8_9BACT